VRPGWDDKVLADWNGLMIAALARAGAALERDEWIAAATRAFDFICERMSLEPESGARSPHTFSSWPGSTRPSHGSALRAARGQAMDPRVKPAGDAVGEGGGPADPDPARGGGAGRLAHSFRAGRAGPPATLDDYAAMIRAAAILYEVTGGDRFLAAARGWLEVLDAHYWDPAGGGYFLTADDAGDLIVRTKAAADAATPSGNGTMAAALARLFWLTGEEALRARAEEVVRAFAGEVERNVFPLATLLNAVDLLAGAAQVAIVGARDDPATKALVTAAHRAPEPNLVLQVVAPDAALPAGHPARAKGQKSGRPTAYVCRGPVCSAPVTGPAELTAALARP